MTQTQVHTVTDDAPRLTLKYEQAAESNYDRMPDTLLPFMF